MGNDFLVIGIDFVGAILTLMYIAKLLSDALPMGGSLEAVYGVSKVSLRGQQIARRLR